MSNKAVKLVINIALIAAVVYVVQLFRSPSPSSVDPNKHTATKEGDTQSISPLGKTNEDVERTSRSKIGRLRTKFKTAYREQRPSRNRNADLRRELKLKIDLPYELREMDLHDERDIFIAYGKQEAWNSELVVAASPKVHNMSEAIGFGKELLEVMPNHSKYQGVELGTPTQLEGLQERGFSDGAVVTGKLKNGEEVHFVQLVRADKKGTYLFITSGPSAHFEDAEEMYEEMFNNLSALPQP